jgi:hypothetical protein
MQKKAFFDNRSLDVDFYRAFYKIEGDTQAIRDHYSTVGVSKSLLPNYDCYTKILSIVLNFDLDVFVSNGAADLGPQLICETHKQQHANKNIRHFMNLYYGNIMDNSPAPAGQINLAIMRLLNSHELMDYNKKWDSLINDLYKHFKFDSSFYLFFYKDIVNVENPFMDWLTDGIFKGRHPNSNSFKTQKNVISDLSSVLHAHKVDLNYVMKSYYENVLKHNLLEGRESTLSEVELPIYVFTNVARKKRLFWSESERNEDFTAHTNKFCETVKYLKGMNFYDMAKLEKMVDENEKVHLMKIKQTVLVSVNKITHAVEKLDTYLKLLKKIVKPDYIETFKKINKLDDLSGEELLHNLLNTLVTNIIDVNNQDINVMQVKSFVMSFFYNSMLAFKGKMSKDEYIAKVKTNVVQFLKTLFENRNVSFDLTTLENDLDYLIKNKKFVKMTRLFMKLLMLLI